MHCTFKQEGIKRQNRKRQTDPFNNDRTDSGLNSTNTLYANKSRKRKPSKVPQFMANCSIANESDFNSTDERAMTFDEAFILSLQVFIALFGVIGNILVITVITKMGKKKQEGDLYLLNLAIADLGTLLLTFPSMVVRELHWKWPFGEFICLYVHPVPEIFYGASVWCIAVVAIDRYRKIVTSKTSSRISSAFTLRTAKIVAACLWMASFLVFCLPLYFVMKYHEEPGGRLASCNPEMSFTFNGVYMGVLTFFSYILPLTVITFTYIVISRVIIRSSAFIKLMKKEGYANDEKRLSKIKSVRLRQNERAKKILTPLVLTFAVTMLPLNIFRLVLAWKPALVEQHVKLILNVVTVFVLINSSANPVIYSVVSKEFRKLLANLCLRGRERNFSLPLPLIQSSNQRKGAV